LKAENLHAQNVREMRKMACWWGKRVVDFQKAVGNSITLGAWAVWQ